MSSARRLATRARQVRASPLPVPSPCLSICRMEQGSALCAGCFRTLDEIAAWGTLPDAGRRVVWGLIEQRALAVANNGSAVP